MGKSSKLVFAKILERKVDAGDSADLNFVEKKPPGSGKYTYKPRFSSPHNDANNYNHQPTKTVTFQSGT